MLPDEATVHALRSDLALQIKRHVDRQAATQVAMAKRLKIPQPTLSKIMRGQVEAISLELLLKVSVRASLPVVLQTGLDPTEAGAWVSGTSSPGPARTKSRLAEEARLAVNEGVRSWTPQQRLEAQRTHSELVAELHRAGKLALARRRG